MAAALLGHPEAEEVVVKAKPSRRVFALILDYTDAKRVRMSEALAATVPPKVMKALRESVKVIVEKGRRGRPRKWSEKGAKRVMKLRGSADKKAERLGISRRSYFYMKKKIGKG